MQPMALQPVRGTKDVSIFPYIRKIDLMSSNSYILSSPKMISVIDPGGLEDQIEHLEAEVARLQEAKNRPVVVYLTHVHLDHWIQYQMSSSSHLLSRAALAVHEAGARALEEQDSKITLSGLLGRATVKVPVPIKLLSDKDKARENRGQASWHSLRLDGWTYDYARSSSDIADDLLLDTQTIALGDVDLLDIYHTPGHSPDSICMRVGSLMFLGDLFFAPNPGMAGAYGWSRQDLMQSILKILWILENEDIDLCFSGHGRPVDVQTAKKTLKVMYSDASLLHDLEEITPQWAKRTATYAQDLMSELERIFTIIAGRLAYIAHMLFELEEEKEAKEMDQLLDASVLDQLFFEFHTFASQLKAGKKLDLELVHKAGQVVGRLECLFQKKSLDSVLDQSLLNRAGRMLSDYSVTYRGYRPPYFVSYMDVNDVVGAVLEQLKQKTYDEHAILEAESEEDYLRALSARIAYVDLFQDVDLIFQPDSRNPFARMDKDRFGDILIDILERFVGAGIKKLKIEVSQNETWVMLRIGAKEKTSCHPLGHAARFLERNLALCGGLLEIFYEEDGPTAEIELSGLGED